MKAAPRNLLLCFVPALVATAPADAHPGGPDANGCHDKAGAPNPDIDAPVRKPRENTCHDFSSPNYRSIRCFISYPDMPACLESGGRPVQ